MLVTSREKHVDRIRIAVIGTRGIPNIQGGIERYCEALYSRLATDFDITLYARSPYFRSDQRPREWKGVRIRYIWSPRNVHLETIVHTLLCLLILMVRRPDIIHIHGIGPAILVPLARFCARRLVLTHQGEDYRRSKWGAIARIVLKIGERLGVRYSDSVLCVSRTLLESVRRRLKGKLVYIPNGVSTGPVLPQGVYSNELGISGKRYAMTACRFVPEKGILELIEAFQRIEDAEFRLVIAGDADHETDYSRKVRLRSIEDSRIILTGAIHGSRIAELYSNAAVFVLPSSHEGLPLAVLEALGYGLPVLISRIPQHLELNLPDSWYCKPRDATEIRQHLLTHLNSPRDHSLCESIATRIKNEYNWDRIADEIRVLFRSLVPIDPQNERRSST